MFKIIGGDGKEYGPISAEQLRTWIAEGRANGQTMVRRADTGDWQPLANFPEFGLTIPVVPPPLAPVQPSLGAAREAALNAVRGPAIFMLVTAVLNIVMGLLQLKSTTVNLMSLFPNLDRGMEAELVKMQKLLNVLQMPIVMAGMLFAFVCIFGAVSMLRLRHYTFCIASAILMLLPCGGCCCLLGLGCGIWSLVVLSKPEIKAHFE